MNPNHPIQYTYAGRRLRVARERVGLSRAEVADAINRHPNTITLYELDYSRPPVDILVALADALGVHVEEFFVPAEDDEAVPA